MPKRRRSAAEKRARRERRKRFMFVFINGKQKRVPRPALIDGLPVDEFFLRNADPIWLHENELWDWGAGGRKPPVWANLFPQR